MILSFQNTVTSTSFGETILQLNRNLIKSVEPHEVPKKEDNYPLWSSFVEGSYSELYHYTIVIKSNDIQDIKSKDYIINEIKFINHYDREAAISYIHSEMTIQQEQNSFYKKQNDNQMKTDF
ncbi:MAG: hypothetical protein U9N34_07710 [Candidatus Cloacimonadota bacterium]|nr:hypothetical protein [Candidatus Cloacimonadota bacterium]